MVMNTLTVTGKRALEVPVKARSRVDATDVEAPPGYVVEPVLAGLDYPNSLTFGPDGTLYVCEGGGAWPFRPYTGARVLALGPDGNVREVATERENRLLGITYHDGALLGVTEGKVSRLVRYEVETGRKQVLVDGMPGGGIHPPTGPVIGPDGNVYFGQATASVNGIMEPQGFAMGVLFDNPKAHDVPGQDVTLTGAHYSMEDDRKPFPKPVKTGGFKPLGTPGKKGETVQGETLCTSSVLRARPDGSEVELLAWGVRVGLGMAFNEQGELYVADNNMEDHDGIRPVGNDPDRVWRIRHAKAPHGSVSTPDWHGYPDICADGKPVDDPAHQPKRGPMPERLIENPPRFAGAAPIQLEPNGGPAKMDFCRSDAFGHRGHLFLCRVGSFAPATTPNKEALNRGYDVLRIDPSTGRAEPFLRNTRPGPATPTPPREGPQTGGMERPIDCKFSPDDKSLYVLDLGRLDVHKGMTTWGRTGVLWRVTPEGEVGA